LESALSSLIAECEEIGKSEESKEKNQMIVNEIIDLKKILDQKAKQLN